MNRLEEELASLNCIISTCKIFLKEKKDISYEDWCKVHEAIDELSARRSNLLKKLKVIL